MHGGQCIFTVWAVRKSTLSTQLSTEFVGKTPILSGFFGFFHILAPYVYFISTDFGLLMPHFQPIPGLFMANYPFLIRFYVIFTVCTGKFSLFYPGIIFTFVFIYCITIS